MDKKIKYPYLPAGQKIRYVVANNVFMLHAKKVALVSSLDETMPTGSVLVRDGQIIGEGANGSNYHKQKQCERVRLNIPTGQSYELCEGCNPKNHSERRAISDAKKRGNETKDAELYLWGHWWCCEDCWNAMAVAGVNRVILLSDSDILFNKDKKGNIVKHQWE